MELDQTPAANDAVGGGWPGWTMSRPGASGLCFLCADILVPVREAPLRAQEIMAFCGERFARLGQVARRRKLAHAESSDGGWLLVGEPDMMDASHHARMALAALDMMRVFEDHPPPMALSGCALRIGIGRTLAAARRCEADAGPGQIRCEAVFAECAGGKFRFLPCEIPEDGEPVSLLVGQEHDP
ncbi:MAG: hypothetical protein LBL69_06865 [Zoogloeaceae bacterium]|nr:hypothetical protein [Zoogloeaceae bacterium]